MSDLPAQDTRCPLDKANLRNTPNEAKRQQLWIQECLETHEECSPLSTEPFLPTRLLEVRNYPSLRLVNTSNYDTEDRRYTALSYCWGDSMPVGGKTTSTTLESHQREVALAKLPRTLRDAIEVTVSWSIPYIWIDALCIIQGDTFDWHQESGDMALVYSHATATIAAAVSDHCDGGFLLDSLSEHDRSIIFLPTPLDPLQGEGWIPEFFQTPIFNRGWTLQERELSTRVVYFTASQVIFECRCATSRYERKEAHQSPSSMPLEHYHTVLLHPEEWQHRILDTDLKIELLRYSTPEPPENSMNWNYVWQRTVEEYSRRKFTDPTDKLQAIAGLADAFERKVESGYLAGLWMNNLAGDLLWRTISPPSPKSELDQRQYIAPSWSWASSSKPVEYTSAERSYPGQSIAILESNVNRTGRNEKGKLAGGYLKVRCLARILSGTCREMRLTERNWFSLSNRDRPQRHSGAPLFRVYNLGDDFYELDEIGVYWDKETDMHEWQDVLICLVNVQPDRRLWQVGVGLALRQTDDGLGLDKYKRVGVAANIPRRWIESAEPMEIVIV